MTEDVAFALIAALALAGWAYTLVRMSLSLLPMANAFKVQQSIVQREDDKVTSLYDRAMRLRNRGAAAPPASTPIMAPPTGPMADIFRGGSMERGGVGIGDQPDPEDTEIMEGA